MLTLAEMTRAADSPATAGRPAESRHPLREQLGLAAEIRRLSRERSLARFENQLLNEIVRRDEVPFAVAALLRRLAPQSSLNFAALVDVSPTPARLIAFRGPPDSTGGSWTIPDRILERLQVEPWLAANRDSDSSDLVSSLVEPVRGQAGDVGIRDGSKLVAVLVTSSLWPTAASDGEQLALSMRLPFDVRHDTTG